MDITQSMAETLRCPAPDTDRTPPPATPPGPARTDTPAPSGAPRAGWATIARRRRLVLALNVATVGLLLAAMTALLSTGGILAAEWAMLATYAITLPWLSIGLWNSLIGFWLDRRHGAGAAAHVTPALARITGAEPITARVAIVMPLRNEDPAASIAHLRALQAGLAATPWADRFAYHILSDTDRPAIAAREEAGVAEWRRDCPLAAIHYRRRARNTGYKAGNIAEFLDAHAADYDYFLPLDADSVMGAGTVLRLVRVMEAAPELGLLQSLVTGLPSRTFFTRAFQFGMRHGMRSYTLGSAWWQADCGPNWGHNALIRTAPFHTHCLLPVLPGRGPLSGHVLSHDQLEAALMRREGLEVRVMAEESESHEENPPSLADFLRRELRWCNGNLQYLKLLGMPGLAPVSRLQLWLAVQMYLAAPAWMLFLILGAGVAARPEQTAGVPLWAGLGLFGVILLLNLMPKIMGIGQIVADRERAARYGGRARVVLGGLAETLVSMLTAPIVAFGLTLFCIGLIFGRRVGWDAQQRSRARLEWSEAARVFWPQTVAGLSMAAWFAAQAPWALAFGAPVLVALILAIPIAVVTTLPALGRWSITSGIFDIPEDGHRSARRARLSVQPDAA